MKIFKLTSALFISTTILEQKNLLIQNLTNGKIVLKEKNDSSIGFFQKVTKKLNYF